jgi:hypothetical protein
MFTGYGADFRFFCDRLAWFFNLMYYSKPCTDYYATDTFAFRYRKKNANDKDGRVVEIGMKGGPTGTVESAWVVEKGMYTLFDKTLLI